MYMYMYMYMYKCISYVVIPVLFPSTITCIMVLLFHIFLLLDPNVTVTTSPSYIEARDFPPFNTFSIHCRVQWSLNITANITVEWTINDQSVGPLEGHSVNIEREDKEILAVLNISNGMERHFVYECVAKISVWREEEEEEEEEEFYGESEVIIYGKREREE